MNLKIKSRSKLMALVVCLMLSVTMLCTFTQKAYAWEFHGIDMTDKDNVDLYYMDITLASKSLLVDGGGASSHPSPGFFTRENMEVLFMFTFPFLKFADTGKQDVFLMKTLNVECPDTKSFIVPFLHERYDIVDGTKITFSLTNMYYKRIIAMPNYEKSFANFKISMLYIARGQEYIHSMFYKPDAISISYDFNATIKLYSKEVDSDEVNPDNPDAGSNTGNNGDNTKPPDATPPPATTNNGCGGLSFDWWLNLPLWGQIAMGISAGLIILFVLKALFK